MEMNEEDLARFNMTAIQSDYCGCTSKCDADTREQIENHYIVIHVPIC